MSVFVIPTQEESGDEDNFLLATADSSCVGMTNSALKKRLNRFLKKETRAMIDAIVRQRDLEFVQINLQVIGFLYREPL